jgi:hypothetical protein
VHYEDQRERYHQLQADQQVVEQAARGLRDRAISDGYLGLEYKHLAFALAMILDELALHLRDLDEVLQQRVVDRCRKMLNRAG